MSDVIIPLEYKTAKQFIVEHHRHNDPPPSHRFSIGLERDGVLIGVAVVGRPVARMLDDGFTVEVTRLTTLGDRNVSSRLYGAACRAASAMGYRRAVTYTLVSESGASLRASGFTSVVDLGHRFVHNGGDWKRADGAPRSADKPTMFFQPKVPTEPKMRWERAL